MPSPSETAHVRWLQSELKRLDAVIEEGKRARKLRSEVNKLIALYAEAEPTAGDVVKAVVNEDGRIHCPECAETFTSNARVGDHLRKVHDIWGGLSGKVRADRVAPRNARRTAA